MSDDLVTVASYSTGLEAEMDRTVLASEGILAFVADAHVVATNWFLSNAVGGVKIQVRAQDLERARAVLKAISSHRSE